MSSLPNDTFIKFRKYLKQFLGLDKSYSSKPNTKKECPKMDKVFYGKTWQST